MTDKQLRYGFYSFWLILMLLQAYCVELQGDEAYYWRWSRELAWGYFDHPPVVAVLVKAGYLVFQHELGVRLWFVFLITGTVWLLERLVQPQQLKLFYAAVMSIAFLQIGLVFGGGMYALPDFPLVFFTALFFLVYRKFLKSPTVWISALLALTISLMLLSKYHGILVVGFTVLSNLSLLRQRSFWLVAVLTLLFFLPHVWWQYDHDFVSLVFQLYERNTREYSIRYFFEYIATQPFVLGPLVSPLLLYAAFRQSGNDPFYRSMKFTLWGIYFFFLLMAFKGRVEANWTVMALVPLMFLGYPMAEGHARLRQGLKLAAWISIPVILVLRLLLIANVHPGPLAESKSFGAKRWSQELKHLSQALPAAFMNSYQRAAQYEFYSGVPAFSHNNIYGRNNQYTVWDTEAAFQGKDVVLVSNYPRPDLDSLKLSGEYAPWQVIPKFRSTSNVVIVTDLTSPVTVKPLDTLRVKVALQFSTNYPRDLDTDPEQPTLLVYSFTQPYLKIDLRSTPLQLTNEWLTSGERKELTIVAPATPGDYSLRFSTATGNLPAGINSRSIRFRVR
jgi:hypothetical protein